MDDHNFIEKNIKLLIDHILKSLINQFYIDFPEIVLNPIDTLYIQFIIIILNEKDMRGVNFYIFFNMIILYFLLYDNIRKHCNE